VATEAEFTDASVRVKTLTARPSNEDLLALYSLFKQATTGDATGKRPSAFNMVARAKFDAWAALKGTSATDARQRYVDLVDRLLS